MKLTGPHKYDIEFTSKEIISKKIKGVKVEFSRPVTYKSAAKLYIVSVNQEPVYVGAAMKPIGRRLSAGLKGTYKYKWKNQPIRIWMLEGADKMAMETVEGEVVFLIRQQCDQWPKHQNEIHFQEVQ